MVNAQDIRTVSGKRGGEAYIFPEIGFLVKFPKPIIDSAAFKRVHSRAAKRAGRIAMLRHHRLVMPKHFEKSARTKYKHKERTPDYKWFKKTFAKSTTDLIHSGKTKQRFTSILPRIQVGGKADKFLRIRAFYRWPFPVGRENKKVGVKIAVMGKEIATLTDQELQDFADTFRSAYIEALEEEMASSPRLEKRIGEINQLR